MNAIDVFNHGKGRSEHLLKLAELLTNTRQRRIRTDWAKDFKGFMHWKQREQIDRVDGTGAILILRETSKISAKNFGEDYTSELLRAAHVTVVAALDRYCHQLIANKCIKCLSSKSSKSAELRKIAIPIEDVHKAVKHAKKPKTRPMNIVKASVQELLYKRTFQSPDEIAQGLSIVGVTGLWTSCSQQMGCGAKDVTSRLNKIVSRRNKIVHEGDIVRHQRGGKVRHAEITPTQVANDVKWLDSLVNAIEAVL
jgi:hypothetical protein